MDVAFKKIFLLISFIIVFIIKLAEVEYLSNIEYAKYPEISSGRWANKTGDSFSYIGAMENYITTGSYYFLNEKGDTVKAGRSPYYALPYFVFRQFSSPSVASDLMVALQIAIETIAIICLALLTFYITGKKWVYYLSIAFSVISLYVSNWLYNTYTDSAGASLLLIAAYFYFTYATGKRESSFLKFSIVLAVVVCIRPFWALLYVIAGLAEVLKQEFSVSYLAKKFLFLSMPLFILLSPWVVRNFLVMDKFILFQQDIYAGYGFDENELAIRNVLISMGENGGTWWDKKSAASYFSSKAVLASVYTYPTYITKDHAIFIRLENLRALSLANAKNESIQRESKKFIQLYKQQFPLRYYVSNRLVLISNFLFHNGSFRLPADVSIPSQYLLKVIQSLLYYCTLVFGSIGLFQLLKIDRRYVVFLIPSIYLILMFPVFLGLTEARYFLPFYHFQQIGLMYLLFTLSPYKKWVLLQYT